MPVRRMARGRTAGRRQRRSRKPLDTGDRHVDDRHQREAGARDGWSRTARCMTPHQQRVIVGQYVGWNERP